MSGVELMAAAAMASAAVGAASAIQQGKAAQANAEGVAQAAEYDAAVAGSQKEYELARMRERTGRLLSSQRAAAGGSGVTGEGSPMLLMAQAAEDAELDELALKYAATTRDVALRAEAAQSRAQGRQARVAGYTGAGASLITGASRTASIYGFQDMMAPGKDTAAPRNAGMRSGIADDVALMAGY